LVGLPKEIVMAVTACPTPRHTPIRARNLLVLTTISLVLLATVLAGHAHASTTCILYAAQGGSDNAPGTLAQPFASVQRLANALSAGQTGCVRGGAYTQDVTITHAGSAGAPITITSNPGERATLTGRLWVHQGADYVTVSNMNLNGRNTNELPSPDINAAHTTFTGNDVTDEHTAICFDIGSDTTYGRATSTIIQGNRIHQCGKLPAANHDHGIYVESSTGATIVENVIYGNADRGIQLYPDAQQTTIEHNIIDSNGEGIIFSGDFGLASSNNTIANNLITNATLRYDIESWYPEGNPIGQNNTVQHNCLWGGAKGTIQTLQTGFTATNNTTTNPEYANPTTGDYRINSTSPCATLLTNTQTPTQPFTTTSTTTYTPTPTETTTSKKRHRAVAAQARRLRRNHRSARERHRHAKGAKRHHRHTTHGHRHARRG
jgi:parallel beta-helix repeat protein